MPTVKREPDIAPNKGTRVRIEATLERVPLSKGGAAHAATALRLDDGTLVWVTYSDPPSGWEAFVGQPVTVEALIWPGPPPNSKQAVIAPHISDWSPPVRR
jgi:hypothetical protein